MLTPPAAADDQTRMIAALILAAASAFVCPDGSPAKQNSQYTVSCPKHPDPGLSIENAQTPNWPSTTSLPNLITSLTPTPAPPLPKEAFDDPSRFCRAMIYFAEIEGHHFDTSYSSDGVVYYASSIHIHASNGEIECRSDSGKIERK